MSTTKPIVIALTGKPGVGKDTIADMLAPRHGFERIAFADTLRHEISEAWRIDQRVLTERATKEWPLPVLAIGMCSDTGFIRWCHEQDESLSDPRSPRWTMQNWGDYQRRFNPNHYADIVARKAFRQIGVGRSRIVVTDLRYPVELDALAPFCPTVIRVIRSNTTTLQTSTASHSSEQYSAIPATWELFNESDDLDKLRGTLVATLALAGVALEEGALA
jgi:hypothetical protein